MTACVCVGLQLLCPLQDLGAEVAEVQDLSLLVDDLSVVLLH